MRPACRIQPSFTRSRPHWSRDILSFARYAMPFLPQLPAREPQSVGELLLQRAAERPDQPALAFVADPHNAAGSDTSWTYAELDRRARAAAAEVSRHAAPGDRAVLVYPPGLDFVAAYFGCLYAGVLPAPASYPKPRRPLARLDAIVDDCAPKLALTTADTLRTMQLDQQAPPVRALVWIATDQCGEAPAGFQSVERSASDPAFLQYTSGSTSQPRGVVVTHGNLLHNLELIRQGFGLPDPAVLQPGERPPAGVFWLPAYHDMGLIGGILSPLYAGGTTHLLAPATFLQRPMVWLETLSRTGATVSGAPNFAYELCARKSTAAEREALDLSRWKLAFCGAEPIDADALDGFAAAFAPAGFRREAFYPCYGLAEATLLVTGGAGAGAPRVVHADRGQLATGKLVEAGPGGAGQKLVSCGGALGDQEALVVDPVSAKPQAAGEIGEIWVRGASVAAGYWNHPEDLATTFGAHTADGRGPFLRTGDLGSLLNGELFITGRLKDLIIIRGRNVYPQDIERTVQQAHEAVEQGAAFSVGDQEQEELVVVHQVSRERRKDDLKAVMLAIRAAIVDEHEVDAQAIVLLRPATLPMTSSGKVQRGRCREMYLAGELQEVDRWTRPTEAAAATTAGVENGPPRPKFLDRIPSYSVNELAVEVQQWMLGWLASRVEDGLGELTADSTFAEMGIDSLTALELNLEFEKVLGLRLPPGEAWSYPTPAALAHYLAKSLHNIATMGTGPDGSPADSWFAAMDADVER